MLVASTLLTVVVVIGLKNRRPFVGVPTPENLSRLDPQLRDYVNQQLNWVGRVPNDPERQATLGLVYAANLLWPEALQCFSNYTRLNPLDPLGQIYLAVAVQEVGNYAEALQRFRHIAQEFPDFAPAQDRLGTALLRSGAVEEAQEVFRQMIKVAPGEWRGYAGLGESRLRLNAFSEAAEFLERARSLEPGSRLVHHLLGNAYRGLGRNQEAEWELRLGLNSEQSPMPDPWGLSAPKHVRLLPRQIELADEYVAAGKVDEAIRILGEALKYHPDNLTVLEHLSIASREMGQFEKAQQFARRMIELDNRSVKAHVLMADACLDLGLHDQALKHANLADELGPDLPQPCLVKADALFAIGRIEDGLAARKEALRRDPQNPLIVLDIGDALLRMRNDPRSAKEFFEKAAQMDPTLAPAHVRLAEAAILLNDFGEARHSLDMAKKLEPDMPALAGLEARLHEAKDAK